MNEANRGSSYRVALDSANSELEEIMGRMTYLHSRKVKIEGAMQALKPILEEAGQTTAAPERPQEPVAAAQAPHEAGDAKVFQFQRAAEPAPQKARTASANTSDALQRQIDHALGMLAAV